MAQFISQVETHGSTAVTPKSHEIAALCNSLTSTVYSPTQEILQRAIETSIQTDPEMLYKLGTLHELGLHGLPKDVAKSLEYYELAASQGNHLLSLTALASVYADMADQSDILEYRTKAIKYFTLAANLGSMDGVYNLGVLAAKSDQKKALSLWHQSAEHRHLPSLITLSDYYWCSKQYANAVPYLKVATDLGDERSQCLLATAYIGGLGVDKVDYDRAVNLLEPLAMHGTSKDIMTVAATNLGNIYVNEALFLSKINPNRGSQKITDGEIILLIKFIKQILAKSIIFGGSTIRDFHNSEGKSGEFQNFFNVYGKEDEKCPGVRCKGTIKRIVLGSRATFFCPTCQIIFALTKHIFVSQILTDTSPADASSYL